MHSRSPRAGGPFVTVHCPSLSAELLESELFGHVKGAFTGAVPDTTGKAAAADGGTLFLDEIGDLPLSVQPKLLRLVQDKAYERVGETRTRVVDVRILTATNRDLAGGDGGGTVPRGPLLSPERDRGGAAAVAAAPRRHPAAGGAAVAVLRPAVGQAGGGVHAGGAGGAVAATAGRATSASCATPSSAASSWRRAARSIWRTCRPRSARRRRRASRSAARDARRPGGGAHPPRAGRGAVAGRGRRHAGHRPQHAVPQAEDAYGL